MQASYSVVLLVYSNYSLTEIRYCFLLGEIIIVLAPLPYTFTAPSKYMVHQSVFLFFPRLTIHFHQESQNPMAHNLQWLC